MLKETCLPKEGVPIEETLKSEMVALEKLNCDEHTVFAVGNEYSPVPGDLVFIAKNQAMNALKNAEDNLTAAKASGDVNRIDSAYSEYVNCFEMAKAAKIEQYKAMRDFYDSTALKASALLDPNESHRIYEQYSKYDALLRQLQGTYVFGD